jgi:subtilisin-like proprotein convertase family protein
MSHPEPNDLGILLVSPEGQTVLLMSRAGGSDPVPEQAPITLTFDDAGLSHIPETSIEGGTFQPSACPPIPTLPSPAPAPPYGSAMSALNGPTRNPNGIWKLYVYDFGGGTPSVGKIEGSWCLTISPTTP